jgi:phage shock protein C
MSIRNNRFTLDKRNKRFLGVCAGLANYLEAPIFLIRIISVLACLAWPTLIFVYFGAYWWLKSDSDAEHSDSMYRYVSRSRTANHFRKLNYKRPIYRNTRRSRIAGVCSGIADYLEIRVSLVRLAAILSFFFVGPFVFFAYFACWIVLDKPPAGFVGYNEQRYKNKRSRKKAKRHSKRSSNLYGEYYKNSDHSYAQSDDFADESFEEQEYRNAETAQANDSNDSIAMSLKECYAAFNALESRVQGLEAFMTSRRFRLHCEINRI